MMLLSGFILMLYNSQALYPILTGKVAGISEYDISVHAKRMFQSEMSTINKEKSIIEKRHLNRRLNLLTISGRDS
ncbi:hypothetical protein [Pantoea sp. A4]|uniref:hypothetical protein n=1 Tax=Pantoea sp. A4 TaxID=1225184 RepID=UPI000B30BE98|nr:hypothetical protein [Pantoea sp. A4]